MFENELTNFKRNKEQFPGIRDELLRMREEDQQMIEEAEKMEERKWGENHTKHLVRIKEIVNQIGWPTISKVGEDGSYSAWLIVQHADEDIEFQKSCLALMQSEKDGEVLKENIAHLIDRIRVNNNEPTLYGTQSLNGELLPIYDIKNLAKRRESMGLSPDPNKDE